jgi:hypothetical protein
MFRKDAHPKTNFSLMHFTLEFNVKLLSSSYMSKNKFLVKKDT